LNKDSDKSLPESLPEEKLMNSKPKIGKINMHMNNPNSQDYENE